MWLPHMWGHRLCRCQHHRAEGCSGSGFQLPNSRRLSVVLILAIRVLFCATVAVGRTAASSEQRAFWEQHHETLAVTVALRDAVGGVVDQPEVILVVDCDRMRCYELSAAPSRVARAWGVQE